MNRFLLSAAVLLATPVPAIAQNQSEGYKFLQAVKEAKGDEVIAAVERPGSRIVNTRDISNGESALHIVVKRGDSTYLRYFLQHGADPDLRDGQGNTPLLLAVTQGEGDMINTLVKGGANVNLGNTAGETPLIRAVQRRDVAMVRQLLQAGANPDQRDRVAGLSARDYAGRDTRTPALLKVINEKPEKPAVAIGPKL
jgi:ankyrin repeat protein